MKRDARVELFRCVSMFGIVLIHALGQGGYAGDHRFLIRLFTPCVVGFIFISGYFGIKFSVRRVVKLIGIGLGSAITITAAYHVLWMHETDFCALCRHTWKYMQYAWFLWMYIALMVVAPLVEPMFEKLRVRGTRMMIAELLPLLIMIFGWSYCATKVPKAMSFTPNVVGFGGFGVLTFFGVYCAARATSFMQMENVKTKWLVLAALFCVPFVCLGFSHYHSPFALVLAGSCFYLFKRIPEERLEARFCKAVLMLSPSLFPVYLLHNNAAGLTWLAQMEDKLIGECAWEYHAACIVVAICVFAGCILLDIPRRMIVGLAMRSKG